MSAGTSIRIYDLARELKQDTKRVIEELRREGADVSIPSNSVSKELAEKVRNKYFPKAETASRRIVKVIKKDSSFTHQETENKANLVGFQDQLEINKIQTSKAFEIRNEVKLDQSSDVVFFPKEKVDCQKCCILTKHTLIHSVNATELNEKYQIIQCMNCENFSFRRIVFRKNQSDENEEEIDLYPSRIKGRQKLQLESIPSIITQIYEEIHLALSNKLFNLSTTGMRTLIELICKDQNSTAKNLKGRIDDLVDMKLLTLKNANNLHKLRDFGNDAAHEANIQSEETLNKCIDIIEHLLKDIYSPEISS